MNPLLVVFSFLLSIAPLSTWQQDGPVERKDIYQEIPQEQREQLKQAVGKLVAAEKAGDWKTVYVLLDKQSDETEDDFVAKMKSRRALQEFRPSKVTFMPPYGSWNIQGCASLVGERKREGHVADLSARWKDSSWYLSIISFVPFGTEKGGKLRECSFQ